MSKRQLYVMLATALAASSFSVESNATAIPSVSVATPFVFLDNVTSNLEGALVGQDIFYGAVFVSPVAGTTATATANGQLLNRPPLWQGSQAFPNMFDRETADSASLRGPWTLVFSNPSLASTTINTTLSSSAVQVPFVTSLSIKFPTSLNPEISWNPPPNTTVNGYRINIYDTSTVVNGHPTQVYSQNLLNTQTSFTLPNTGNHQAGDVQIQPGVQYVFEVQALQTKNNGSTLADLSNDNLLARSRYFSSYTQPNANSPTQIYLPVVLQNGSYQFNVAVQANQTYYIDPTVATGYIYKTNPGDPNFASVVLPTLQGSTPYHLSYLGSTIDLLGGVVFDFGAGGVDEFTVTGIDPSLMLDPNSSTAFITGLTFTGPGVFTGTQTPITTDSVAVPVPASLPLFLAGLAGLALIAGRKRRNAITNED